MSIVKGIFKVLGSNPAGKFFRGTDYLSLLRHSSLWVPDYLELAKSKYPEYSVTNVQMKGFDYVVLEKYQKKVHWLARKMNLDVTDCWAQELQKLKVIRYKTNSETPECDYVLKVYERNVQVSYVYGCQMPLFIDLIMTLCPPGVKLHVHGHELAHYENRYVPEYKVLELQEKLEELDSNKSV